MTQLRFSLAAASLQDQDKSHKAKLGTKSSQSTVNS